MMLQVDSSCKSIGILNLEWAVLPPRSSKDVIPDEAIASTILPCPHGWDKSKCFIGSTTAIHKE
jgi:hypothetical protein